MVCNPGKTHTDRVFSGFTFRFEGRGSKHPPHLSVWLDNKTSKWKRLERKKKKKSIVDKRTCTAIHIIITYLTITVALLYLSHWTRPLLVQHLHYYCCLKVTYPTHLPKDLQVPFKTKQQQRQRDQNTAAYDEGKVCFLSSLSMHCFGRKHLCLLFFQFSQSS